MSIKLFCSFCVTSCFALRSFLRFSSFIISSKYREAALEKLQQQCLSKDTFFPWAVRRYITNRSKNQKSRSFAPDKYCMKATISDR